MTTMAPQHPHRKATTPSSLSLTDEVRRAGRAGMHDHDGLLSRRTELVLKELDTLPTLPSVATRLIQLGSQDEVEIREIVRLIEVDPTLTAKLLSLCRRAATRTRYPITTVEMAVVMLGLDAVRSLVLSVQVFDWASSTPRKVKQAPGKGRKGNGNGRAVEASNGNTAQSVGFDRVGFWQHSIAVACCADLIAREHPELDLQPEEAFVCGLVHDLGKLALDLVLPKAYSRVIELSELREGNIADFERPIVGLDHHTAGLRLGERWGLPELLRDVMAYHATAFDDMPKMDDGHATVVTLVGIADALCRKLALGWSGNHAAIEDDHLMEQSRCAGLNWQRVENVLPRIYEATSVRCKDLGLGDEPSQQLLIESILRANSRLGRLNHDLADANRALEDAQSKLTEARAMACLGEMTAGAAHEMNNPLAVISGRAQGMLKRAENEGDRASAHAIIEASMRLNTLIHRLHRIATPPKPTYQPTDLKPMLEKVIARAKTKAAEKTGVHAGSAGVQGIKLLVADGIEPARMDPELFADALTEVVVNALEAGPKGCVEIQAFAEAGEDRLVIQITDDGRGMSEHALAHATDPFFSEKPAGRQSGLGLALAHRLLQAQGASLAMQSRLNRGTAVAVMLPHWRWSTHAQNAA